MDEREARETIGNSLSLIRRLAGRRQTATGVVDYNLRIDSIAYILATKTPLLRVYIYMYIYVP